MTDIQLSEDELIAVLRLQRIPNVGDVTAKKLITNCGSAIGVFEDKERHLLKIDGVGTHTIKGLFDTEHLEAARAEYSYVNSTDIAYSYFMHSDYPR